MPLFHNREEATAYLFRNPSPENWPHYPLLPIRNRLKSFDNNPYQDLAVMCSFDVDNQPRRWVGRPKPKAIFTLLALVKTAEDLSNCPKMVYETIEDMIADGWEVD